MRPQPRWPLVLLAALAAVGLWAIWQFDPSQSPLPLCAFYRLTGWLCPGCGATRATHALLHGQFIVALHDNTLWVVLLPVVAYSAAAQVALVLRGRPLPGDLLRRPWFLVFIGAVMILFGVVRNLPLWPCTLLVPV